MLNIDGRANWPDPVLAELTLVDSAGRTTEPRVLTVPVVRHAADDDEIDWLSLTRRLVLFLVLPLLAGIVVGSVSRRRR